VKQPGTKRTTIHRHLGTALLALVLLASTSGVCRGEAGTFKTITAGEKAPLFKTITIDGQPFDLQEHLAKKNIVLFFWSLFCSPCREEMPAIQIISQELKDQPVEVVGLNLDEPPLHNPVRNFLKSAGFSFTIALNKSVAGGDSQSDKLYLVTGTPTLYLIKQDGTVAYSHVGPLEANDLRKLIKDSFPPASN
jgi:cytochrome c biogenesis protein CcmG, thiol:disulfide interchange protein DsbE